MTGAESVINTAVAAGIDVCFANPGTTEIPLVQAIDNVAGMRAVLVLFEGVATGAADGYSRMTGKPGLTLLHLGPGFANGIAYLHDAKRARSSIINLIGEHATWHIPADPPLNSDIESLARPVSHWVHRNQSAETQASDMAEAVAAASVFPGRIATLILPNDYLLADVNSQAELRPIAAPPKVEPETIVEIAKLLRQSRPSALFLGGFGLRKRGLQAAARIAAATGCQLICETAPTHLERGAGSPHLLRLPYFPEPGMEMLAPYQNVILAGARNPVTFFGYPNIRSYFVAPEQNLAVLATPEDDIAAALEALADELGASANAGVMIDLARPERPTGRLTPETLARAVAAVQPEGTIIMEEGISSTRNFFQLSNGAPFHSYLAQPGGAIGLGMPCATGAAIACPDRPVITLQSDGAGMYTLQALWTQAREGLNVTTLLCNNRQYQILNIELRRAGIEQIGDKARTLIGLDNPSLDWVSLAKGMGVAAVAVETAEALTQELEIALAEPGPHLIEVRL
ncbi:MAG: acetolactate synthase large subunit [Acidobacteria bacterium]|nr:acetolactate synthase large subunit [Acidobacteriota bacterium]